MKTRTIITSALLLLAVFLSATMLAGCAKRTPEQTVAGFFKAVQDRDYNKAKSFITTRFMDETGGSDAKFDEMATPPEGMPENPFTLENLLSEITTDTAKVWHKDFTAMKWVLKQEGGQWKIDDVEFDLGSVMQDMGMPEDFQMPEGMNIPGGMTPPGR